MFQTVSPIDPKLRTLPFPYKGALSISSDVEFFSFRFFEEFMKFLNTKSLTGLGQGLGLEVTSSLFFYTANPHTFSYFDGELVDAAKSNYANRIDEYLKIGWIDTNHSYGYFSECQAFTREYAVRSFELLSDLDVTLEVFTNHGGNRANLGNHQHLYNGDDRSTRSYHADLLKENGVKYVWLDSGSYNIELLDKLRPVKNQIQKLLGRHTGPPRKRNELFKDEELRDGTRLKGFIRFRSTGKNAPNLSTLDFQIKQIDWQRLYNENGVIVLYQHLGVLSKDVRGHGISASTEAITKNPDILAPFYFLAEEQEKGNFWVCGTQKILRYVEGVESSKVTFDQDSGKWRLEYEGTVTDDPQVFFRGLPFIWITILVSCYLKTL
ncbi:MAG: hypothetical protein OXH57_03860 [Ekhidna sp.]|nr:hypothetical protein [Ekhidna sp.]